MSDERLDDCPFCGGHDIHLVTGEQIVEGVPLTSAVAECRDCKAHGTPCVEVTLTKAEDAAVECWNTRSERTVQHG